VRLTYTLTKISFLLTYLHVLTHLWVELVVTERQAFVCTFEEGSTCLLSDNNTAKETWDIVDGRGVVADNTLNTGR